MGNNPIVRVVATAALSVAIFFAGLPAGAKECPEGQDKVLEGENPWDIAERVLGDSARWHELGLTWHNGCGTDGDACLWEGDCVVVPASRNPEVCNGKDDDGDSAIDEGDDMTGKPDAERQCGRYRTHGVCASQPAAPVCSNGKWECGPIPAHFHVEETKDHCDGLDNDCDGQKDEECNGDARAVAERAGGNVAGAMVNAEAAVKTAGSANEKSTTAVEIANAANHAHPFVGAGTWLCLAVPVTGVVIGYEAQGPVHEQDGLVVRLAGLIGQANPPRGLPSALGGDVSNALPKGIGTAATLALGYRAKKVDILLLGRAGWQWDTNTLLMRTSYAGGGAELAYVFTEWLRVAAHALVEKGRYDPAATSAHSGGDPVPSALGAAGGVSVTLEIPPN